jgi:hypothetical protein
MCQRVYAEYCTSSSIKFVHIEGSAPSLPLRARGWVRTPTNNSNHVHPPPSPLPSPYPFQTRPLPYHLQIPSNPFLPILQVLHCGLRLHSSSISTFRMSRPRSRLGRVLLCPCLCPLGRVWFWSLWISICNGHSMEEGHDHKEIFAL